MKIIARLQAMILILCMVLSLVSTAALAESPSPDTITVTVAASSDGGASASSGGGASVPSGDSASVPSGDSSSVPSGDSSSVPPGNSSSASTPTSSGDESSVGSNASSGTTNGNTESSASTTASSNTQADGETESVSGGVSDPAAIGSEQPGDAGSSVSNSASESSNGKALLNVSVSEPVIDSTTSENGASPAGKEASSDDKEALSAANKISESGTESEAGDAVRSTSTTVTDTLTGTSVTKMAAGQVTEGNSAPALTLGAAGDTEQSKDSKETENESKPEEKTNPVSGAEKAGLYLTGDRTGKFNAVITGTLKSEGTPILLSEDVNPDNVSITVWKIENPVLVEGEKHVVLQEAAGVVAETSGESTENTTPADEVQSGSLGQSVTSEQDVEATDTGSSNPPLTAPKGTDPDDSKAKENSDSTEDPAPVVTEDSKKVEDKIQYIIKVEPSQQDYITLGGTKQETIEEEKYELAKKGETVTMKITVPDGYTLKGAYNGEGTEMPLDKDKNGDYYIVVPIEGGIFLHAELDKKAAPAPSGGGSSSSSSGSYDEGWSGIRVVTVPTPKNTQKPCTDLDDCEFTIDCDGIYVVFKLNGGTLAGTVGPILIPSAEGELFALLSAPVKPGYRFVRWEPCCPKITATQPGETFVVKATVVFVAVWAEGKSPVPQSGVPAVNGAGLDDDDEGEGDEVEETVHINKDNEEELDLKRITVKETDKTAVGVEVTASQDVDVDKAISVTGGDQGAVGVRASSSGQNIKMEVETGSGMTVTSSGSTVGIETSATGGGNVEVKFEGNVDSGGTGAVMEASDGGSTTLIVEGDLG